MHERSPGVRSWCLLVHAAILASLASACDAPHPTSAPTFEPAPFPGLAIAPGTELGVGDLPIPADNGAHTIGGVSAPYGSLPWTAIPMPITGPQWVRVRVEGTISVGAHPGLEPYMCREDWMFACLNGPLPLAGAQVGPMGRESPDNWFWQTELRVQGRIRGESLPFNAAGGDAAEALAWVSLDESSIELSRTGAAGGYQPCFWCTDPGVPYYVFGGSQRVSVTAVAPPVEIISGAREADGQTRFEARSEYQMVLTSWHFYPGDVGPEPNWGHSAFRIKRYWEEYRLFEDSIRGCTGQPTCDYRPAEPGRLYVRAALVGTDGRAISNLAVFAGPVVGVEQAKLTLVCTGDQGQNAVTRGQAIRCEAGKDPASAAGAVSVTEWSFDGASRTDGEPTSPVWEGVMVRSGTVQVRGKIGSGPVQAASATITVANRIWGPPTFTVKKLLPEEDSRLAIPLRVVYAQDLGAANFFPTPAPDAMPHDPTGEVVGGPNHELYYYEDLTFPIFAYYVLNTAAMTRGSAFHRVQEDDNSGNRIGTLNWCSRSVVTSSLPDLVEAHELRHIDVYRYTYTQELQTVLAELEPLTGTSFSDLVDRYQIRRREIDLKARAKSEAIHDVKDNPDTVTPRDSRGDCALKNEDGHELRTKPSGLQGSI